MAQLKTQPTDQDVETFLQSVPEPAQSDCRELVAMMAAETDATPVMWGSSMVGFGSRHLRYDSGRELEWFVVGFAPRKRALTLYLTGGLEQHADQLTRLGPHSTGKGCLYVRRLDEVDRTVLAEMIRSAVAVASAE